MASKKKKITLIIIFGVILLAVLVLTKPSPETDEEIAKCIAKNSELYVQLGCHACEIQEKMFGDNCKYLNIIDCFFEREKCIEKNIRATPTWIINGKEYIGVQSIEKLKNLTGC